VDFSRLDSTFRHIATAFVVMWLFCAPGGAGYKNIEDTGEE
jgi:hypothetical protein